MPDSDLPKIDSYRDYEARILRGRSHAELSGKDHTHLLA